MAYVYRHIRLDKNEVFYIGIGNDSRGKYSRANNIKGRSRIWKNITKKTNLIVEIIEDNLTWEEACSKEKWWIKFYGRKNINEGPLCNLTDGGEGIVGLVRTEEHKKKQSVAAKNRPPMSQEIKDKISRTVSLVQTGVPCSAEKAAKISQTLMGHKNSPSIPCSAEKALKISKAQKGRPLSEEHRAALRVPKKVKPIITQERCDNIRKAKLGLKQPKVVCPHCNKEGGEAAMTRYHFNNCKLKK
jgi:hypothetical protein